MPDAQQFTREDSLTDLEYAVSVIVAWATRNDVHQETMRRARCNLPRGHAWLLGRLEGCGPVRLGELAAVLGIDNSTLTPQTQRLERDGLVVRETDPADGRAALVRITRAGRQLLARLHSSRRALLDEQLSTWPDDDRARAAAILSRLAAAL
ncbi:MAG: hypothetical protein QOH52_2924 [Pseudonocardiales bacterium]|jgi:DNA-binding MarR family transcriptional regulator|nr:hypothetical protein [Pseudonocardiales bacterium]